jgi:hypothetical protein
MLELAPNDPLIKAYLKDLRHLKDQEVTHELGLKGPFQTLLDKAARRRHWTLVPELSTFPAGGAWCRTGRCGTRTSWRGDSEEDQGRVSRNTIFEDTDTAVLYQDGREGTVASV